MSKKSDFSSKNIKKTESPKITSKVLHELLIRSYEGFKYFSHTWNLTISKKNRVYQRKSLWKNWISTAKRSKKCNFKKWTKNSSRSLNPQFLLMGNLSLKIWNFKSNFRSGNQLKITMVKKDLSLRCKLRKVFNFIFFKKMRF